MTINQLLQDEESDFRLKIYINYLGLIYKQATPEELGDIAQQTITQLPRLDGEHEEVYYLRVSNEVYTRFKKKYGGA